MVPKTFVVPAADTKVAVNTRISESFVMFEVICNT
jgi:hypothetical protein